MSSGEEDRRRDEIVLVRRVSDDHDGGHHGGAWKIAYADFMTAMMALFLVMWLVNAASKDTRAQVASYFNPIKLSDSITSSRGLSEMQPGQQSRKQVPVKKKDKDKPAKKTKKEEKDTKTALTDADFFSDPHGVLAKLAKVHAANQLKTKGEAFRDPFDPAFRKRFELVNPTQEVPPKDPEFAEKPPAKKSKPVKPPLSAKPEAAKPAWAATVKKGPAKPHKLAKNGKPIDDKANRAEAKRAEAERAEAKAAKTKLLAKNLQDKIKRSLGKFAQGGRPAVNVKVTKDGVVLSLTDKVGHSMFDIGSAVPKPQTVALVDTLAKAITEEHKGSIVISGHTDARAFAGAKYDNWRLSTDRAHAFYHMLSRGGVDMARVDRVQGYAARKLKVGSDPNSPLNRRVEITLQTN
ncbi:MAG: MotB family protein [Hyphomicrobiaceae bacterium]